MVLALCEDRLLGGIEMVMPAAWVIVSQEAICLLHRLEPGQSHHINKELGRGVFTVGKGNWNTCNIVLYCNGEDTIQRDIIYKKANEHTSVSDAQAAAAVPCTACPPAAGSEESLASRGSRNNDTWSSLCIQNTALDCRVTLITAEKSERIPSKPQVKVPGSEAACAQAHEDGADEFPKRCGVDRIKLLFLAMAQVVAVECGARQTDPLCGLVVIQKPLQLQDKHDRHV